MNIIFIFALCCISTTATGQFQWRGGGGATSFKTDCFWHAYGQYGHCWNKYNDETGEYQYKKKRGRVKTPAKNGGAPCTGDYYEERNCTAAETAASIFMRTLVGNSDRYQTSALMSYDDTAFNTSDDTQSQRDRKPKCSRYLKIGEFKMSGNNCRHGRRRRRALVPDDSTTSRTKRQAGFSRANRDVLFILDESGSIGSDNFKNKVVRLAKAIATKLCGAIRIGHDRTRIGVMTFDSTVHAEIDFDTYFSRAELLEGMDHDISYHVNTSSQSCFANALSFAKDNMFDPSHGARETFWDDIERIVIYVSDGCANCGGTDVSTIDTIVNELSDQDIPIFTYLITASEECQNFMERLSDGSQCYQQYHVPTWEEFDEFIRSIEKYPCMTTWEEQGPRC